MALERKYEPRYGCPPGGIQSYRRRLTAQCGVPSGARYISPYIGWSRRWSRRWYTPEYMVEYAWVTRPPKDRQLYMTFQSRTRALSWVKPSRYRVRENR